MLASIAVPDLHADDVYPNCIVTAIDPNSGVITSQETGTGKIFYFQVTDAAQLEHVRIHQGIWIKNGQVSFDGVKLCACKVVNSPADVLADANSKVSASTGPVTAAAKPSSEATTNAVGESPKPGNSNQTSGAPQTGARTMSPTQTPLVSKSPTSAAGSDVLVLRDGKRKSGSLVACAISTCLIGTSVVPRQNIQWIGLSLSKKLQATPPPPQSSTTDELHLADGSIYPGALLGILADSVTTVNESRARQTVKWVHLALVSGKQKPTGFEDATPNSGNASNPVNPPPPPPGGSAPPTAPSGSTPKPSAFPTIFGSKGGLWIGTVHGDRTVTYTRPEFVVHHYTNTIRVKLREVVKGYIDNLDPPHSHRVGSEIDLINEGTQVEVGYQGPKCSDHAASSYPDDRVVGQFWYKTLNEPIKNENDIPHEGLYTLTLGTGGPVVLPLCQHFYPSFDQLGGRPIGIGYPWGPGPDSSPPDPAKLASDAWDPQGYRKMSPDHARMVGDYAYENQFQDGSEHVKVDWDICRVGSAGCVMGAPQINPGPCSGQTASPCANQLKAAWHKFNKIRAKYQEKMQEAGLNQDAYRSAVAQCAAWDAAMKIMIFAIGPEEAGATTDFEKEVKEFQEAMKVIAEISDKTIKGESPLVIAHSEEEGLQDLATFQQATDIISNVVSMFDAGNPEAMQGHLEECGAPLSDATYLGAVHYVESLKAALDLAPEMQSALNDIRQKEIECEDNQYQSYSACVQCARSQGADESSCNNLKPQGNWPPVQ